MKYTQISLGDMTEFLNSFASDVKFVEVFGPTRCRETVYDHTLPNFPGIVVRVFSSIHKDSALARAKGADAIRVCAVNFTKNIGWIRSTRVLRVEGWRDNLHRAIVRTISQATDRCEQLARAEAAMRNVPTEDIPFEVPA
jgi:hypothetical protein